MLYPLSYEGGRGLPSVAGGVGDELCASAGPGRSSQRGENRVLLVTLDLLGIGVFAASGLLAAVCGTCCSARSRSCCCGTSTRWRLSVVPSWSRWDRLALPPGRLCWAVQPDRCPHPAILITSGWSSRPADQGGRDREVGSATPCREPR